MPVGKQNKIDLIDALGRTKSKALRLALTLRFQNQEGEAERVRRRAKLLTKQIDRLISEAMNEWIGSAAKIKIRLDRNNTRLQSSIRAIQKRKDVSQNIVRALSYVDDTIEIAAKLIA